jgi:hypothetical protein
MLVETKTSFVDLSDINLISSNRIVKDIVFSNSKFPTLSRSDVERMKGDDTWLSDSHVYFSLMFVPSTSVLSRSQGNTGTALSIAPREGSGEMSKFTSWTQDFGQCCPKILIDLASASGAGLICWSMILF